jgi:hypothetical protein
MLASTELENVANHHVTSIGVFRVGVSAVIQLLFLSRFRLDL